jgi:hypothetical protein
MKTPDVHLKQLAPHVGDGRNMGKKLVNVLPNTKSIPIEFNIRF